MNERIEKLGEEVDLLGEFTPTKIPGRYVGYITEEKILKFAQLIVQDYANKTIQALMRDPAFVQAMDEYYERKWAHRFD